MRSHASLGPAEVANRIALKKLTYDWAPGAANLVALAGGTSED